MANPGAPLARRPWTRVALVALGVFALLAVVVRAQGTAAFDAVVGAAVRGPAVPPGFWEATTEGGGGSAILAVRVALVLLLLAWRRPRTALVYGIAFVVAEAWTRLGKEILARDRPPGAEMLSVGGFSFPSGHALNSTVTYGLVALLVWRSGLPTLARRLIAGALVAIPVLVGLSRVGLDVHYPSDVAGGWLAGLAIVAVVALLTDPDPDAHAT